MLKLKWDYGTRLCKTSLREAALRGAGLASGEREGQDGARVVLCQELCPMVTELLCPTMQMSQGWTHLQGDESFWHGLGLVEGGGVAGMYHKGS